MQAIKRNSVSFGLTNKGFTLYKLSVEETNSNNGNVNMCEAFTQIINLISVC